MDSHEWFSKQRLDIRSLRTKVKIKTKKPDKNKERFQRQKKRVKRLKTGHRYTNRQSVKETDNRKKEEKKPQQIFIQIPPPLNQCIKYTKTSNIRREANNPVYKLGWLAYWALNLKCVVSLKGVLTIFKIA